MDFIISKNITFYNNSLVNKKQEAWSQKDKLCILVLASRCYLNSTANPSLSSEKSSPSKTEKWSSSQKTTVPY